MSSKPPLILPLYAPQYAETASLSPQKNATTRTPSTTTAVTQPARLKASSSTPGPPTSNARAPPQTANPSVETGSSKELNTVTMGCWTERDAETTVQPLCLELYARIKTAPLPARLPQLLCAETGLRREMSNVILD